VGLAPEQRYIADGRALLAYCLIEDSGAGENRKIKFLISPIERWRHATRREGGALAEAATKPKLFAEYIENGKSARQRQVA
jgi:hypothetical protein